MITFSGTSFNSTTSSWGPYSLLTNVGLLTELVEGGRYEISTRINPAGSDYTWTVGTIPSYAVFNYQENAFNTPFEYLDRAQVVSDAIAGVDVEADNVEYLRNTLFTLTNDYTNDGILFIPQT